MPTYSIVYVNNNDAHIAVTTWQTLAMHYERIRISPVTGHQIYIHIRVSTESYIWGFSEHFLLHVTIVHNHQEEYVST